MKNLTLALFLAFIGSVGFAQERKIDSLRNALHTATHDSIRLRSVTDIYQYYQGFNYDSVLFYADKGLSIARKSKQSLHEGRFLVSKANTLVQKGEYAEALKNLLQAFEILQNHTSEKNAYGLGKETSAEFRLARLDFAYYSYGELMAETGNIEQAIFHFNESVRIASLIKNYFRIALASSNIAELYNMEDQLDSVEVYAQKSVKFFEQINNYSSTNVNRTNSISWRSTPILILAKKSFKVKNDEMGRRYLYQALQVATEFKETNRLNLLQVYNSLSSVHQYGGVKDSALYYAKKAYEVGSEPGLINTKWFRDGGVYEDLHKAYLLNNQLDSAFKYQGLALTTKDSWNKEKYKNLATFQSLLLSEASRLRELEKQQIEVQSKIRTYGFLAGLGVLSIIGFILYRNNRQKQKANKVLQEQKDKVESTLHELKSTQTQLIQSEKMASLGELTAGIAHEIQNPLNFVNNFSEVSAELVEEIQDIRLKTQDKVIASEEDEILEDIKQNLEKITLHGKRASDIVKGMLEHSKRGSGQKEQTDLNALAEEFLRLSYKSSLAKDKEFSADLQLNLDPDLPKISVIPQDIGKVLLNLYSNAFYACAERSRITCAERRKDLPGFANEDKGNQAGLTPQVTVSTKNLGNKIEIKVSDNGPGIPDSIKDKIFQPFFTTKPTGQGTGLGLSLSYDIVKAHGGEIKVDFRIEEFTTFKILLPV